MQTAMQNVNQRDALPPMCMGECVGRTFFVIDFIPLKSKIRCFKPLLRDGNCYLAKVIFILPFLCLCSIVNCIWNSIILYCVHMGHDTCSLSLPFPIMLRNDSKEPCKTRFCEHFLQNVPCKFIVPRMMMLHTACVCAGPVFQKILQEYCTLPGWHMTQQL